MTKKSLNNFSKAIVLLLLIFGTMASLTLVKNFKGLGSKAVGLSADEVAVDGRVKADIGLCSETSTACSSNLTSISGERVVLEIELYNSTTQTQQLTVRVPIYQFSDTLLNIEGSGSDGVDGVWSRMGDDYVWQGTVICHSAHPSCANGYGIEYLYVSFDANLGEYDLSANLTDAGNWTWIEGPVHLSVVENVGLSDLSVNSFNSSNTKRSIRVNTTVTNLGPDSAPPGLRWYTNSEESSLELISKPCNGTTTFVDNVLTWKPLLGCSLNAGNIQDFVIEVKVNNRNTLLTTETYINSGSNVDPNQANNKIQIKLK